MISQLIQLIILFFVILDPPASLAVFCIATSSMKKEKRHKIATLALLVAASLSLVVLLLGDNLLKLFSTSIDEFRIAGGIILGILGIRMALGIPLMNIDTVKNNSGRAIAALIATPMLTGPAAITAIIVSVEDYGLGITSLALLIVFLMTAVIFYQAERINKILGRTAIQVISTIMGLITISWGVRMIIHGLMSII